MSAPASYLTIARAGAVETEVKRSRFCCRLRRVDDEDQARAVVDEARRQRWEARHHCSAFILGPAGQTQRSSDDGEPAGTAGAPMLEVRRGRGVSDVVAVVSRYFGGTLLGAGGLARAYSDAVRAALDDVGVVRRRRMRLLDVTAEHADAGRLEHDLRARGVVVEGVTYAERATLRIAVPDDAVHGLQQTLAELTSGAVDSREAGSGWAEVGG